MVKVRKQPVRGDLSDKAVKKPTPKKKEPDYEAYQSYIKSKGFKELRLLMLERENYTCQGCNRTLEEIQESGKKVTLQAHHRSYQNVGLGDERELKDLTCLCSVCHKGVHSAKSNLRRFTDKHYILDNLKENPNKECRVKPKTPTPQSE